jgi:hypothetical protein
MTSPELAVVTGATSGIGRALSAELASRELEVARFLSWVLLESSDDDYAAGEWSIDEPSPLMNGRYQRLSRPGRPLRRRKRMAC